MGPQGQRGIGFKITADGNYDMNYKRIYILDTQDDHRVDNGYENIVKDLKSAANKEYLNYKFLKKVKDGNYVGLK